MASHNFGEKTMEYSTKQGKEIPVWQTPKYQEARKKAVEIIDSGKYGLTDAHFWILMNETKNGKMAYTSLIISHNGCLMVNDKLEDKFRPSCVVECRDGWNGSLVYSYQCEEQGLYEVGEVSTRNCKNDYPYAMALKRLFDRVVLKLSKLAYSGIMSDSESEEFSQNAFSGEDNAGHDSGVASGTEQTKGFKIPPEGDAPIICEECTLRLSDYFDGERLVKAAELAERSTQMHGRCLCTKCAKKVQQ